MPPEDHAPIREAVAKAIEERSQYSIVHRMVRPDGGVRIVQETAEIFCDERTGMPLRLTGTAHDITEQRRAQGALRASEERFRTFMAYSPLAGWIVDASGRFRYVSPGYYTMCGGGNEDLTGRSIEDIFEPALAELYLDNNRAVMESGSALEVVEQGRRSDGSPGEFLVVKFPLTMPGETELMLGGVAIDITERKEAEEALRASEQRFRSYFELPLLGHAITTPSRGWVQVNDHLCTMLGYSREELLQLGTWADLTHPDDVEPNLKLLNRVLAGEIDRYDMEKRYVRKDGTIIWTSLIAGCIRNPDGSLAFMVSVISDISERMRAERTLLESEERFRQLAENLSDAFWITDPGMHKLHYMSPAFERIWGFSCETLYEIPRTWVDSIHPEDVERIMRSVKGRGPEDDFEEIYRIVRPDGVERWIHARGCPVRDEHGEVYRLVGTSSDVTERKQVEEILMEQATLLDKARDAIIVRDLNHVIRFWNHGAERLYGWTEAEAVGRSIKQLLYRDPADFLTATDRTLSKGEWQGEIQQKAKDGHPLVVECRWTLVRDDRGQPKSILAINTDVTERKRLEDQILRAQRMESIGTLAGGIAHDLNNVLAPILMSIDLLRLSEADPRRLGILSTIEGSARRGADMVRQVLSFAQGVVGDQLVVNIGSLIREIEKIANETFLKSIHVKVELEPDLWTVKGDPTQLHQVLLNLCVNARDAMPEGGRLTVSATNLIVDEQYASMNFEARPGPHVVIHVEDTGTGMSREVMDRIFEPFFTTKEPGKGTGLGLSTTTAIIKSHGGFMRVYSEPGTGTKFQAYLPAHTEPAPESSAAELPPDLPRGNGELVLVVDDEQAVREITRQTLEAYGYRVIVASDGVEATAIYAARQPEVSAVLTDMMMPLMDGPTTIQVLKRINPHVRIIAASGLNANRMVAKAASAGVRHFLPKPYTAEAMLTSLHEVLCKDV